MNSLCKRAISCKPGEKILITGGCRSGKSEYALSLAENFKNKVFLATATAGDREMAERIARHRERRGPDWRTEEEPYDLAASFARIEGEADMMVIDCLTLWLSNLIGQGQNDREIMEQVERLAANIAKSRSAVIVISNEVGAGIVPENDLARRFRDLSGFANQIVARAVPTVVLMTAGLPLYLKGGV